MWRWVVFSAVFGMTVGVIVDRVGASPLASSTFDGGNDAWQVVTFLYDPPVPQNTFSVTYNGNGGNPGGYISIDDPDQNNTYFAAPSKFLGNKAAAYGGVLEFDAEDRGGTANFGPELLLMGSGEVLIYSAGLNPSTTWTHFEIPLWSNASWHLNTSTAPSPTEEQMQVVLSSLDGMYLWADWIVYADNSGLDNVTLIPEPATLSLLALGGMMLIRRRRTA